MKIQAANRLKATPVAVVAADASDAGKALQFLEDALGVKGTKQKSRIGPHHQQISFKHPALEDGILVFDEKEKNLYVYLAFKLDIAIEVEANSFEKLKKLIAREVKNSFKSIQEDKKDAENTLREIQESEVLLKKLG